MDLEEILDFALTLRVSRQDSKIVFMDLGKSRFARLQDGLDKLNFGID